MILSISSNHAQSPVKFVNGTKAAILGVAEDGGTEFFAQFKPF